MRAAFRLAGRSAGPVLVLLALLAHGCSSPPPPGAVPPPQPAESPEKVAWSFEAGAIRLAIDADPKLNAVDGVPHALALCIVQAASMDKLAAQGATKEGLRQLLQCKASPPDSISAVQFYIQPGERKVVPLDRSEGARYIAIAAGYDALNPGQCFRTVQMPVHTDSHHTFLLFGKVMDYTAAKMNLNVNLGQDALDCTSAEQPKP
ncbi:MAG: type VI secretion system lipoprotein TssJ [Desulfovibrio sp.]|nr:type VI secretion system lipoprotein TssJ [Desulfovibrio sp.]